MLSSHAYAADCVCPTCAEHRNDRKLAVIADYINWANAPLRAAMTRFVDSRQTPVGVDVPVTLLRSNGIPLPKVSSSIKTMRLLGHA